MKAAVQTTDGHVTSHTTKGGSAPPSPSPLPPLPSSSFLSTDTTANHVHSSPLVEKHLDGTGEGRGTTAQHSKGGGVGTAPTTPAGAGDAHAHQREEEPAFEKSFAHNATSVSGAKKPPAAAASSLSPSPSPSPSASPTCPVPSAASTNRLPRDPVPPECITLHKNPDLDNIGMKAVLEGLTNPATLSSVQHAFRTMAFVTFPMFTIAMHPNTTLRLGMPQMLVSSVMSTSIHRPRVGEHLGTASWCWRGYLLMCVLGTLYTTFNLPEHLGAWWGIIAATIFGISLVSHGTIRRFLYLYIFVYLMQMRMKEVYFSHVDVDSAAWYCADLFIGSLLGLTADFIPYPLLTRNHVDEIMTKLFTGVGKMVIGMTNYVLSPDPHAAALFFNDYTPFSHVESALSALPALLWFCNWEPLEFPIRNPIRRLKLSLMRRILALCYAAFSTGRTIVELRKYQANRIALYRIRQVICRRAEEDCVQQQRLLANGSSGPGPSAFSPTATAIPAAANGEVVDEPIVITDGYLRLVEEIHGHKAMLRAKAEGEALRENTLQYTKALAAVLMQSITLVGSTESKPEKLLKAVPFAELSDRDVQMRRNVRVEMVETLKRQYDILAQRRQEEEKEQQEKGEPFNEDEDSHKDGLDSFSDAHSAHSNTPEPERVKATVLREYLSLIDSTNVFIHLNEIFFLLLLSMIAAEVENFGEMMKDYKPAKPLGRRLLEYFILEPWHDFWEELWFRITFPRPSDYRVVKDAVKMTCAFLSACVFNFELWIPQGGLYFFGMTIILGLPVEEESVRMAMNRMAGHTFGCSLGYLAYHNTDNFAQYVALSMCLEFLCLSMRDHATFGHFFFYSAIMVLAGGASASATLELMTRIVCSTFAAMAYLGCTLIVFPTNPIKVCAGYRVKLSKAISELIDDVALTARYRIAYDPNLRGKMMTAPGGENGRFRSNESSLVLLPQRNTAVMKMCSQMNVELSLTKMLMAMSAKWSPFAVHQPVVRGTQQFPAAASQRILDGHLRMVASVQLLVFGVQLLHRPRSAPPHPVMEKLFSGSVATFLDDFAGAVRLILQSTIDSLQTPRKWSNPTFMTYVAYLSRMRVRIQAILFELYVTLAHLSGPTGVRMIPGDFTRMQKETATALKSPEDSHEPFIEVRADDPDARERELNATFASQYLQARREAAELGPDAPEDAKEELRNSFIVPSKPVDIGTTATGPSTAFRYQAPLEEAALVQQDAFPFTQESAERAVAVELMKDKQQQQQQQEGSKQLSTGMEIDATDATSAEMKVGGSTEKKGDALRSAQAEKDGTSPFGHRDTSHLVLLPEKGPETHVPLYRGPGFSYREDELDLPIDTDFLALVSLLSSCHSFITEVEQIAAAVNTVSAYHKQLHESTVILPLIDKLSDSVKALRRANYERYHYPPPPRPQQRLPLNVQTDPWQDWRF